MTAEAIAKALGGWKAGGGWTARCPAHDDRTPSLSIRDAANHGLLVHCHAGCAQHDVIAALRARGLWTGKGARLQSHLTRGTIVERKSDRDDAERSSAALAIWHSAKPASGTIVQTYLDFARHQTSGAAYSPISSATSTSLGRRLAGHGRAGDVGLGRDAARDPSHVPRKGGRCEGARRFAEDDAGPLPRRRGASRRSGQRAHGW